MPHSSRSWPYEAANQPDGATIWGALGRPEVGAAEVGEPLRRGQVRLRHLPGWRPPGNDLWDDATPARLRATSARMCPTGSRVYGTRTIDPFGGHAAVVDQHEQQHRGGRSGGDVRGHGGGVATRWWSVAASTPSRPT